MKSLFFICSFLFCFLQLNAQIATYGCEGVDTWSVVSGSAQCSSATGSGDTPASQRILGGTNSWQSSNGTRTLELATVNTTGCSDMIITIRVTSTSLNTSNGSDGGDNIRVFANINGAGYPATADITLNGNNNARWGYDATLTASTIAGTPVSVSAPQGGTNTNNYSTIEVTIPSGTTSLALRISAFNDAANEVWNIDNILLSGTCITCTSPTTPPTSFIASNHANNSMDIAWTNGNGDNTLVVARASGAVNADPTSGSTYTANAAFGSGTQIGTGNYVVYNGTGSTVSVTSLISNTTYHYAIYTYNSVDNCYNLTELAGNATTTGPEIQLEYPVNTDVACGFTLPFGSVTNGTTSDLSFVISNDGTADLTLTLPLVLAGTNSDQYTIITQPTSPVLPGNSTTVTVRFSPTSVGLKTANISIANDDSNENPCSVILSGTGVIACPNVGDLIITEIMYNPSADTESSAEYIEVCNTTASAIDMNGMSINEGGTTRNITSTLIVPANGCVTVGQLSTCSGTPGFAINLGLNNAGEALSIVCNATEIDAVPDYVNTGWPTSTNGFSIQLNPNDFNATDNDTGANWCLSTVSCGTDTGTPGAANTSCCSITSVVASAACNGNNANVTLTFTATGTSGSLEANVDGLGWIPITSGGIYTITGPTTSESGASVSVRDVNENACQANTTVNIPSCPVVCTGGTLNFQMINPCGNDGQNEFISFTVGGASIEIADLAFGTTNDGADPSFNSFWGGTNTSPADYGCVGITSVATGQSFGFLDPTTDATLISSLVNDLNSAAGCSPAIFQAAPATIPAGANVVVFLGAGQQGFDAVTMNMNFSNNCGATYYAVFGTGTSTGGYFSNTNPRLSTLDFGEGCACSTQFEYTPTGGEAGYVFNGGPYLSDQPCIPSSVIMPVEMLSFEVIKKDGQSILYFSTASETNNDFFTIERSADGRDYDAIGEIKGAGNSNTEIMYEFIDEKPYAGINYYRIKQTDYDGKFSYSNIKSVRHTIAGNLSITPRTTEGRLQVTTDMEDYAIDVYNVAGQLVKSFQSLSYDQLISIDDLTAGLYYVKVNFGGQVETIKVVKI